MTIGPAVQLWRRARRTRSLPGDDERRAALAAIGFDKVQLDSAARTVTLRATGMRFDFGGIGKGAAADAALLELRRVGLPRAMVAVGGDIAVGDAPPEAAGWRIAGAGSHRNRGISMSGDAMQFVEADGVRYAHVVDPRTALGVVGGRAVGVIAPSAREADAVATAAFVLGEDQAMRLLRNRAGVSMFPGGRRGETAK